MTGMLPALLAASVTFTIWSAAQQTAKPVLHGRHWVAVTGKPLAATAGAIVFQKGGNAVDAACAMIAATCTMWDTLSWGGETQALIYAPGARKVIGIDALGVAPSGATVEFFKKQSMAYPPDEGSLAAVTPGTPGGILVMLAEYGRLSLAEVLDPALQMADGYPIEAQTANSIEHNKASLKKWRFSRETLLPHLGQDREAPEAGEVFRQPDLAATLRKLIQAEGERYPELFAEWREQGPGRTWSALAARFARLAHAGHLSVDDPDVAARQFLALVNAELQITFMLGGTPTDEEVVRSATTGVGTFVRAFGSLKTTPVRQAALAHA